MNARTRLAALHQALTAQRRQVLRRTARVEVDCLLQLTDRPLALGEQLEHPDAGRMPERAKQLGLQPVDRVAPDVVPSARGHAALVPLPCKQQTIYDISKFRIL